MITRVQARRRSSGGLSLIGEKQIRPFQLFFNPSQEVDFRGSRVISDYGLLLVREPAEQLGLSQLISGFLADSRRGKNTQLSLPDSLRQPTRSLHSRESGRSCEWRNAESPSSIGDRPRERLKNPPQRTGSSVGAEVRC